MAEKGRRKLLPSHTTLDYANMYIAIGLLHL